MKHEAIIDAAVAEFLSQGFATTSMDQIALRADVSKRTVYDHFGDKRGLFETAIESLVDRAQAIVSGIASRFEQLSELEEDLTELAVEYASSVLSERVVRLRRLMISEASLFPDSARLYFEQGPGAAINALAIGFDGLVEQGLLNPGIDTAAAAQDFAYLVLGTMLDRALFHPTAPPSPGEVRAHAASASATFLRAYGRR